jgi:hypothetical protein
MEISKEKLKEWIDLLEKETGRRLPEKDALALLHRMMDLYALLYPAKIAKAGA